MKLCRPPTIYSETLYHQGDEYFDEMIKCLQKAKQTIFIESYIFDADSIGLKLLEVLKIKASNGVEVKILIDGIGSHKFCNRALQSLSSTGIELRYFNPLPFLRYSSLKNSRTKILIQAFKGLYFVNKRNHRKLMLIDNHTGFIGSMNISALHSKRVNGLHFWRDTGVKFSCSNLSALRNKFLLAWNSHMEISKIFSSCQTKSFDTFRFNASKSARKAYKSQLIDRIKHAKQKVWIETPYFVPSTDIVESLINACERGVDVKIIIPRKSDMRLFPLINSLSSRKLISKRINIFEYRPRILHAKFMIIDNWATLGSSNLNNRSFLHDLELDIVLTKSSSIKSLTRQFLYDLAQSCKLNEKLIHQRFAHRYLSTFCCRLIKYWL